MTDSGAPREVKAGEETSKLEAGTPTTVSLPAGTRIVSAEDRGTHKAGTLIAEANSSLNGATIHIK
jgi:hypothetical protein